MAITSFIRNIFNILDDLAISADILVAEAAIEAEAHKELTTEYHKQLTALIANKTMTPIERAKEIKILSDRYQTNNRKTI